VRREKIKKKRKDNRRKITTMTTAHAVLGGREHDIASKNTTTRLVW
jgi:hypothetical protein